jgi:raffinose/stachyose/melibiose transport system permease protein
MIIGTLQGYAFVLILLGEGGGPQGKALVPGLHMFNNAFTQGHLGYACALGLVLFVFILILTEINNRYVKVDK